MFHSRVRCFPSVWMGVGVLMLGALPGGAQTTVPLDMRTEGIVTIVGNLPIVDAFIDYTVTSSSPFAFTSGSLHETADFSNLPVIRVYDGTFSFQIDPANQLFGTLEGNHVLQNATDFSVDFNVQYNGGTGIFYGAYGSGTTTGFGSLTSATTAVSTLRWTGNLTVVPEPGTTGLGVVSTTSLMGILLWRRKIGK